MTRVPITDRLNYAKAASVCRGLCAAAEDVFKLIEQLSSRGFRAFVPYCTFVESFAENADELAIHRQCVVERAKFALGQPLPMKVSPEERGQYSSELLDSLRAKRDRENGVPPNQLSRRYPGAEAFWRREIDPVERKMLRFSMEAPEQYRARWGDMVSQQNRQLKIELNTHTNLSFDRFGLTERVSAYRHIMQSQSRFFGFDYDEETSNPQYPVFRSKITDRWHICITIEERQQLLYSPDSGYFEPSLQIRHKDLTTNLDGAQMGEFLLIRQDAIVPGFRRAYWRFTTFSELELVIKAHLCLYGCIAPQIESSMKINLG